MAITRSGYHHRIIQSLQSMCPHPQAHRRLQFTAIPLFEVIMPFTFRLHILRIPTFIMLSILQKGYSRLPNSTLLTKKRARLMAHQRDGESLPSPPPLPFNIPLKLAQTNTKTQRIDGNIQTVLAVRFPQNIDHATLFQKCITATSQHVEVTSHDEFQSYNTGSDSPSV